MLSGRSLALIILFLISILVTGYKLDSNKHAHNDVSVSGKLEKVEESKNSVYVCPMNCVPPRLSQGSCPICGMELVPLSLEDSGEKNEKSKIRLEQDMVIRAGIMTVPVERKYVSAEVRLFGKIDYDTAHVSYISAFTPCVIDRVYVKRAGVFVRWGDPLFDFTSSDLLSAQQQLIETMKYVPSFMAFQSGTPHVAEDVPVQSLENESDPEQRIKDQKEALKKLESIRKKLRNLGMPKRDIDELMKLGEATGIATVYSPMYGQVIEQNAFEGSYINTGTPVFTLGDPQYVWANLDAYETDYSWIRTGQEARITTDTYPGETFIGKVIFIDPVFNPTTRAFNIGVLCQEAAGRFKPGMLVRAKIYATLTASGKVAGSEMDPKKAPLIIPATAPLITGKRSIVYVRSNKGEELYEAREITLGPKADEYYVVIDGLSAGEEVVAKGVFKLDSAVQIVTGKGMMDIPDGHPITEYQNNGGSSVMSEEYNRARDRGRRNNLNPESQQQEIYRSGSQPSGRRNSLSSVRRRRPGSYSDSTRPDARPQSND